MKKLYVGNIAYSTTQEGLKNFFADYEPLVSVKIITDKFTGKSRGFGFVEIEDDSRASEAVSRLNGQSLDGKTLTINEARPQTGGGGGGGRGFGSGKARSHGGGGGHGYRDRDRSSGGGYGNRYYR
ncbi:MAG: RNA-binding protein [SAR324 cluster bacterium]|uniref:RNA-binding protein n=1 Tax=SAR324 cluster bacterium TaxID=2024889 RepID=A0A7X9FPX2_9DELT|nr:RNA-binding protein [SAR324 cluster bacterium]